MLGSAASPTQERRAALTAGAPGPTKRERQPTIGSWQGTEGTPPQIA